ncbi:MAG TPA: hypothetical protein VN446_06750 [Candidatus Acidoferrum sp.]|nr:hypothetical protein [Candidatus Acidoferrum sp.]
MAGVFDRDLGAVPGREVEARLSELAAYVGYMQQSVEDYAVKMGRKLAALEARVKELENNADEL